MGKKNLVSRNMHIKYFAFVFLLFLIGCEYQSNSKALTPEMEAEAKNTILQYLVKNKLPVEGLEPFNSKVSNKPDFSYLYTGGGRCIEFIVYCNNQSCNDLHKYPYDEHNEKCP